MKKLIATILIIGLILSIGFNLFLIKPKQARALDGGGSWMQAIKEIVLDAIGWVISDMVIKRLEVKIINWGTGRTSPANRPFAVSNWVQYFKDAVAIGTAKYIAEFERTEIEPQIKETLRSLGFDTYAQDALSYSQYARSTLEDDLGENYQPFVDSGYSLQAGGWAGWFSMMKPQNNIFGQILMAENAREAYEMAQKEAADKETAVSDGYRNETITTKTDTEACEEGCALDYPKTEMTWNQGEQPNPDYEDCIDRCGMTPGLAIETRIKNWGSTINKSMTNALGKDMNRIISADEISELIGIFFSSLMNKAINGMGMAFSPQRTDTITKARAESKQQYSYYRSFKKEQSLEDRKDTRATLLSNILKSIQQLSRSIISCEEKEMMSFEDYSKNLGDILNANLEALYVGIEGVNLKPDFEVLDPVHAPYSVYGYSYGHVPSSKFPSKCKKITSQLNLGYNATCRSIKSGLEPNFDSRCENCMYDHDALSCPPAPIPPFSWPFGTTEAIIKQKADFYNACRGWYLIGLNRCDECLKKADEKCDQVDKEQKNQCILNVCSNYGSLVGHIVSPIVDGLDFYNKCLIEEKKEACYTCLREYFVPATYCEQTRDYMARSIIKYPALVKWERTGDDKGMWIGPYDKIIGDRGGECDTNYHPDEIMLSLICRILPDFKYNDQKMCETYCKQKGMTDEQLRDITDFRPNDKDCGNYKMPESFGGKEPWLALNDGTMHIRGKCCATFWQHDESKYAICVGSQAVEEEEPEEEVCKLIEPAENEPWCHCNEGWRPLTMAHLGMPRSHGGWFKGVNGQDCSHACVNRSFTFPTGTISKEVLAKSNVKPGGAVMFLTNGTCNDPDSSICQQSSLGALISKPLLLLREEPDEELGEEPSPGPGPTPSPSLCDYIANAPSGILERKETKHRCQAEGCCVIPEENCVGGVGPDSFTYNFSGKEGQSVNFGFYSNDRTDCNTGGDVCIKCDPSDTGYPKYGTKYNQCVGKVK